MKREDKDILNGYYEEKLKQYGHDTRSLGWIPGARAVRLGALTSIGRLDGCSILDVGCGFGDLYGFLLKKGAHVDYTGIDIMPGFIDIARESYPGAYFLCGDFEEMDAGAYDWAFASGIFTLRISDNMAFIDKTLIKMFEVSRKGFAADFLRATGSRERDAYWQCEPDEILRLCMKLSKRVTLRCDYMPSEFCVYVYKDETADERNVYEGHQKAD